MTDPQKCRNIRLLQHWLLVSIDVAATLAAAIFAFAVRFAFDGRIVPAPYVTTYLHALLIIIPLRIVVYHHYGLYRQVWSLASVPELLRIMVAGTVDTAISFLVLLTLGDGFPRSVILITWFTIIAALGAIRLLARVRREWLTGREVAATLDGLECHRALVFGAGAAGAMTIRDLTKHPELGLRVVGLIDDDLRKLGQYVAGKPVLGTRFQLAELVKRHDVTHLIIAVPSASGRVVREAVEAGRGLGLHLKTIPGLYELVDGKVSVSQIRDVQIEDLLGRPEVKLDMRAIAAYLTDECVLVTGAGGSIGSELCRQVARFGPRQLLLLGHGENSIYEIDMELRKAFPRIDIVPVIADVQDEGRIRHIFRDYHPNVVFHAAAHKHVPLMELNSEEAIKNNVFGTLNVVRAADFYRAKRFVLISTDKAVNPSSVMGATKRAAEYIIQAYANSGSDTVFVAVRFGNVLGSRGSVVPLFKKQIAAGGPVTVTDPEMTRYFMTIPEAAQLVIQAASMGEGGEVFVLDMGKPVRIDDLARDMIRLSGFEPDKEIGIMYTGCRPGEKISEELFTHQEGAATTRHDKIYVASTKIISVSTLQELLDSLDDTIRSSPDLRGATMRAIWRIAGDASQDEPALKASGSS